MIEFKHVGKTYSNGTTAIKDINITISKGEFVFIVGDSGAGKSTFLKLITKEENPTKGEIIINGQNLSKLKKREIPYLRRSIGMVFQDFRLINKMSVYENVAFAMHVTGASDNDIKKRVPHILELVGLKNKYKCLPSEISGGEQQRVALARALVNNPDIIIADEPTGNIDPNMSSEIMDLLYKINKDGTTVLVVTHEQALVKRSKKRVVEIKNGEIISDYIETDDYNEY